MAKSDFSCAETLLFFGCRHCAADLQTQVPTCTDQDLGLLYILTSGKYIKFTRKNPERSAFAFCSPARALAAGLPRHDHVYSTTEESFRFHNKKIDEMRFNWIPLRIRVCWNTPPHLNEPTQSRSDPDSKQKQKQVLYQWHSMCDMCDGTKCHNFEFVTSVTRSCFFLVLLAKQIWSQFGHKCHKWSQIRMRLVQTFFFFCFDWTKYEKTYQKVSSVSVFVWNPDRNGSNRSHPY